MSLFDALTSVSPLMSTLMPKYQEQTFTEYKVARIIAIYGLPLLILAGTVSNVISLLILRCKSFRSSSVSFSLSVLSGVNLGILYVAVLRFWVLELTDRNVDLRVTSFGCKIQVMMTYLLCHMSSWTLVLIVMERTLIVCFPLAAKPYCSKKNTIIVWCVTTGVLILVNCHFLWTFGYIPDPLKFSYSEINEPVTYFPKIFRMDLENITTPSAMTMTQMEAKHNHTEKEYQRICYAHEEYFHFYHNIWPWIDGIMISILPFLLLLSGNLAIVITISKAVKFRNESSSRLSSGVYNKTNSVFSEAPQSSSSGTPDRNVCTILSLKGNKAKSVSCGSDKRSASSSTYMLLGASFLFLFLTTPSGIYLLISDYLFDMDSSPGSVAKYRLAFYITIFMYYLNNSINFFIYYLTGSRFRKSFKEYFTSRDTLDSEGRLSEGAYLSTVLKTKIKALNLEFRSKV